MPENTPSTAQRLFDEMLLRIRSGVWPADRAIPGERQLTAEFGVSRVALREALSMLRSLGVVETGRGRASVVRRLGPEFFRRVFPLILGGEGRRSYAEVFEVRLAIEGPAAALAAARRNEADLEELDRLVARFRAEAEREAPERAETDLEFHLAVARASGNPLFPALLNAISGFVIYGLRETWARAGETPEARVRAVERHQSIAAAIRRRDADLARNEMEAHLRYTAALAADASVDLEDMRR
jgi:GntR family transcriptional regulator, transcriptional repressor for pyruvate dehydrogenase complex